MNNTDRYDATTRWLHWIIFLLFVGLISSAELRNFLPKGSALRGSMMVWHKSFGLMTMVFVIFRIYWCLAGSKRVHFQDSPTVYNIAARGVHLALYAGMIIMPLSGYLMSAFGARPIALFGLIPVPLLVSPHPQRADLAYTIHITLATILYFLLSAHILAALWHRFVCKDRILQRML